MLTEVKKQLNQNLRGLHLPTIRQCYEEQGKLAENNSSTYEHYLHEVVGARGRSQAPESRRSISTGIEATAGKELGCV